MTRTRFVQTQRAPIYAAVMMVTVGTAKIVQVTLAGTEKVGGRGGGQ